MTVSPNGKHSGLRDGKEKYFMVYNTQTLLPAGQTVFFSPVNSEFP